jgi:FkbM family methyltransferase
MNQESNVAADTMAGISAGETATAAVQPDIAKVLEAGLAHHRAGSLGKAAAQYRQVLDAVPGHADALYLLGVIAYQSGQPEMAIELISKAIQQNGDNPTYHTGYGLALQSLTRLGEALESYDRALAIEPDNAEALNNRGLLLHELERFHEALKSYDRALAFRPDFAKALNNRGNTLQALGRLDEAVASYDRALAVEPNLTEATYNRAEALKELERSQLPTGGRDRSPPRQVTMLQVAPPPAVWSQLPLFFSALKARGFAPKHIMDVGANHGHWTRAALNYFPESYYTLIEPQDHLKEHVHDLLARGDGKIQWIGAGAGDKSGIMRFTISYRDDSSSFAVSSEYAEAHGFRQIEVPVVTLNEVTRTSSAPFPEMVKIDAEGFDLRVIEGASELLGRTDIFILETLIFGQGWENTLENVMTTMSRAGYHIIDIPGLNRSPKYGVLWLCDLAFLRNESSILKGIDSYE